MIEAVTVPDDILFDRALPLRARRRSREFWTPASVAAHAAAIFSERNARRILDVGCGPGKFCIVAACSQPQLEFDGMDRRRRLVQIGRGLARRFGAVNVRLSIGDATTVSWEGYDGLYFFNPFAENVFEPPDRFDCGVDLSTARFVEELQRIDRLLQPMPLGTVVVTYHGLGGPIPSSYRLADDEKVGSGRIRTWVQGPRPVADWVWFDGASSVIPLVRPKLGALYESLLEPTPAQ
jgi:SAM-dependent methyltransferase